MTQFNNAAVFAIFDAAEAQSVALATQLMEHGIGCKADAEPFCMAWASKKYSAPIARVNAVRVLIARRSRATQRTWLCIVFSLSCTPYRRFGAVVKDEKVKAKFNAEKAAKQLKQRYTKAQLEKNLWLLGNSVALRNRVFPVTAENQPLSRILCSVKSRKVFHEQKIYVGTAFAITVILPAFGLSHCSTNQKGITMQNDKSLRLAGLLGAITATACIAITLPELLE